MLDEVELLPLIGEMLCEGVNRKKPTAGSLDGWGGWWELKALPELWSINSLRFCP